MGETTEILRLSLAAILGVASVAKLWDLGGARKAMRGFGAPAAMARPLAVALAVVEAVIAIALLPIELARPAAIAATALFAAFALVVAVARLRGRTPDCHCFGRLHSSPAGWPIVARNVALVVAAVVVASRPASGIGAIDGLVFGIAALVLGQALLLYTLLRRYGVALRRIEQLEARPSLAVGAQAPDFALGEVPLKERLDRGLPVLLLFSSADCGSCRVLVPKIAEWQEHLAEVVTTIVLEDEQEVADLYGVEATPSAVVIGADGRVAHALVAGAAAIEDILRSLTPVPAATRSGSGRIATAAALAGGLAVTAAANAAPTSRSAHDPELNAIDAALRAAGPKLVAASAKSRAAVQAQATLKTGKAVRAKRKAAVQALAAERRQVLALRARIEQLPGTGTTAHNVKGSINLGLTLLAQSLQKKERALGAQPKAALVLLTGAERLFVRSLGSLSAAAMLMEREH